MDLGGAVALYGAILATWLAVRGWWRGRRRVFLSIAYDWPLEDPVSRDLGPAHVRMSVVNVSPDPVAITDFGLDLVGDYRRVPDEYVGVVNIVVMGSGARLQTAESVTASRPVAEIEETLLEVTGPYRIAGMWASDAGGRTHRMALSTFDRQISISQTALGDPAALEHLPFRRGRAAAVWIRWWAWARYQAPGGRVAVAILQRARLFPRSGESVE